MNVLLFGATGMVGQGVLRACLLDEEVESVLCVGRSPTGVSHPKLSERHVSDLHDLSAIEDRLAGMDACFFCLGVSSAGLSEEAYRRTTFDLTLSAAQTLVRLNPQMTFVY
ncbi:MAG: NAD-dependent epimerase/dehydratase family protein, partial [Gammaproteobacteria bacterium]|nr:NAD-dependent epimerase/dehydratase family protein [Gammaproteobacteria bacterium]